MPLFPCQITPDSMTYPSIYCSFPLVYRLKSVEALEIDFVAPIPEQIATTTMHFFKASGEPY